MLRKMLRLTAERDAISTEELARALDTSPELVRLALAELARRDLLQAMVPGCSTACERCSLHAACQYHHQPLVWILTRKGEAWMEDEHD